MDSNGERLVLVGLWQFIRNKHRKFKIVNMASPVNVPPQHSFPGCHDGGGVVA